MNTNRKPKEICETVNQCGACGPDLPDFGKDCAVSEECAGTYVCAVDGMSLECKPKNANACGLCNGPEILGLEKIAATAVKTSATRRATG
jgi:hypothetical protein